MSADHGTAGIDYRDEYLVRSYEVEPDGRLRPVVLLRMLQETAWNHASRLGKGFYQRASGELFWVLSRLRIRIDAYPRWGERFTLQTYPVGTDRLLAVREFALLSESGGTVQHHDIDQYRHVNNASYLEWVLDGQPAERHSNEQPAEIALDFVRETVRGDAFTVAVARDGALDRFEVRHADGEAAVRGSIEWAPAVDRSGGRG